MGGYTACTAADPTSGAHVFSAHTGVHYRVLSAAANSLRLRQKHDKELQNNKLQLPEFDNGSVAVVPVNPTSTVAKKSWRKRKINLPDERVADHQNGTDLVVGRHDHEANTSGHQCHESVRAKKKRARALGVGGVAAPPYRWVHDHVMSSDDHQNQTAAVVAPQEHSGCVRQVNL
ncbi:hypothetical protein PS2_005559 [Malus domestica]